MPFKMQKFTFWTGVYNAGLAVFLLFPPLYRGVGLNICDPVWGWLIAGFLAFTSAVLILSSRDLTPPRCFCLLGIAATLHCRAGACSSGTVRRCGFDCRAARFG